MSEYENVLVRKLDDLEDLVKREFNETRLAMDKMKESLHESLVRLKSLQAPTFPYPRHVVVREVDSDDSPSRSIVDRGKCGWLRPICMRLPEVATKEMTLRFLCPVDMSEVPCGFGGEGYRFRETREWVKAISPVLQVRHSVVVPTNLFIGIHQVGTVCMIRSPRQHKQLCSGFEVYEQTLKNRLRTSTPRQT